MLAAHPAPWQLSATASRGARIPELNGVYPGTLIETTHPQEMIAEFAASTALPLCDVISIFRGYDSVDDLFQADSSQLSEVGHRYYAAALSASVLENFSEIETSRPEYLPEGRSPQFVQPQPFNQQPDRFTQQPIGLQPVRPAAYSVEAQSGANRPASTPLPQDFQRQDVPANALVPFSDRR